jgi:UDP-2-acetamido-2-deoxy-ribo-hexuluronate aminotransferase
MSVPFIDIKRFEPGFLEAWEEKVKSLSKNAQFIGGEENQNLEKSLANYAETQYSIGVANGTDAIQIALRAVGVGRGDKVLLPDSTFWATFESVVNVGAEPYTIDTNPEDLQMDFLTFEKALNRIQPKAAILVHLYGWGSSRIKDFRALCKSKNVPLIEDGAQCFGVKFDGESIYKNSLIATTSFYPAKVLGAAGDGGAVFTNDANLADLSRKYANHGRISHYEHGYVGWNSRLDTLQAAFLNLSLLHIDKRLESRRSIAQKYYRELPSYGLKTIKPPEGYTENGYCNVNLINNADRTKLETTLKENGIGFGNIYPGAMSDQPGAKGFIKERIGEKNNTREICSSVLNLPLFAYMNDSEFQEVLSILKKHREGK